MSEALNSNPMGKIDRRNMSFEICTSFAPSRRCVVRWRMRVPMAYVKHKFGLLHDSGGERTAKVRCQVTRNTGNLNERLLYR